MKLQGCRNIELRRAKSSKRVEGEKKKQKIVIIEGGRISSALLPFYASTIISTDTGRFLPPRFFPGKWPVR